MENLKDVIEITFNTYQDSEHKQIKSHYKLPVHMTRLEALELRGILNNDSSVGFVGIHLSGNRVI